MHVPSLSLVLIFGVMVISSAIFWGYHFLIYVLRSRRSDLAPFSTRLGLLGGKSPGVNIIMHIYSKIRQYYSENLLGYLNFDLIYTIICLFKLGLQYGLLEPFYQNAPNPFLKIIAVLGFITIRPFITSHSI